MTFIIGEDVRVAAARNVAIRGLRGRVVLETMHTLTIRTELERNVVLPKAGSALVLTSTGEILLGDDLGGRLEERIANAGRNGEEGGRGRGGSATKDRRMKYR